MESEIIAGSGIHNNKLAIYLPVSGLPLRESHKVTEMAAFHQQLFLLLLVCCTNEVSRRIENGVPEADLRLFNSSLTGMNIQCVCSCTRAVKLEPECGPCQIVMLELIILMSPSWTAGVVQVVMRL